MTEEVKEKKRRNWLAMKSRSNTGDSTANEKKKQEQDQEPKDLLKASSKKSGKESRWFRKKLQSKEAKGGSNGNGPQVIENSETIDLETEDKPVQRTVQGVYRDDDGGPSPKILNSTVSAARDAVKEFAKDFVSQLKGNPNVCAALEAQMRQQLNMVTEAPPTPADLKFLAQAYIAFHLFSGFENASFSISNPGEKPWEVEQHMITCFEQYQSYKNKSQTVSKLLANESPNHNFLSEYCLRKYKSIIPVDVESAMFGADYHHHTKLVNKKHPDTAFYRSFLGAAVSVWLLQRLRCSFEQKVVTISPTRGDDYQRRFMLPAVPGIGDNEDEESDHGLEILFTVFPGFRVSESIVKSLVYIVEKPNPPPPQVETTTPAEVETTSLAEAEATSLAEAKTTSLAEAEATSVAEAETTSVTEAKTASLAETETTSPAEVETTTPVEVETTSLAEVEAPTSVDERPSSNVDNVAAEDQTPAAPASVQGNISKVEMAPSSKPAPSLPLSTGGEGHIPPLIEGPQ